MQLLYSRNWKASITNFKKSIHLVQTGINNIRIFIATKTASTSTANPNPKFEMR